MASSTLSFLFLLFLSLPNNPAAQSYKNISLGTTFSPLTQAYYWPSPSGDFAFGFRSLDTDPTLFLLAVWFNKISDKTVVWTANGNNPVTNQSKAEVTADGQLSFKDSTGQEIWINAGINDAN